MCRRLLRVVIQAYMDNKVEGLEDQLRKMKTQVDDLTRTNGELVNTRNRLTTENSDLQRQIHELETNYGAFSKNRGQLQTQLDDAKSKLEEEIRVSLFPYQSFLNRTHIYNMIDAGQPDPKLK